ncbi:MAG: hypothetical protein Q8916_11095 [Bacteroidota bacterium]|nr:hypothetical protein [Bacteroidota bacterium]MDP4230937.1 hypothetical protein [Bacteroidota bacterium]MDP4237092.1 hypothetical protein [Bacteroidota bacterium]
MRTNNNYQKVMEPLRNREAYPPFENIRNLVLAEKRSSKVVPVWLYVSASAPLLVALSILLFPEMYGLQRIGENTGTTSQQSIPLQPEHVLASTAPVVASGTSLKTHQRTTNSILVAAQPEPTVAHAIDRKDDAVKDTPKMDAQPSEENTKVADPNSAPTPGLNPPINEMAENPTDAHRYSLFISGGMPVSHSSASFGDVLIGAAGFRYKLSSVSSLVVELHRNVFLKNYTTNRFTSRDTSLEVGSQTYHNTIGRVTSVSGESVDPVFALGAGYRYAFAQLGSFTPFAEVVVGGSTVGALASEVAGIGYSASAPINIDLSMRTDQLFSRSSSPLASFSMNIGLNYAW